MKQKPKGKQTTIDLACQISRIYEAAYRTAKSAKHEALRDLAWSDEGQSASKLAVALTQQKIEPTLGYRFQRSTLYRYIRVANQLSEPAQALARAHHFSLHILVRLSKLTPEQQQELALSFTSEAPKTKLPSLLLLEQIFNRVNDLGRLLERGIAPEVMARQLAFREFRCVVAVVGDVRSYLDVYHRRALLLLREKHETESKIHEDAVKQPAKPVQNPPKKVAQ